MALRPTMQFQQLNRAYQTDPSRVLGQALMQQGVSTAPVQSPLQGLGRLSNALVGAFLQRKASDRLAEQETAARDAITAALPANLNPAIAGLVQTQPDAISSAITQAALAPKTELVTQEIEGAPGAVVVGTKTTSPFGVETVTPNTVYKPPAAKKPDVITFQNPDNATDQVSLLTTDPDFQSKAQDLLNKNYVRRQGSAPTVSITQEAQKAGETEFAKGIAKAQVAQLEELSKQANLASENEDAINSILTLYNRAESQGFNLNDLTGPGAELKFDLKETFAAVGGLFGFDYKQLGIDIDKITDQQSLRAAFNELSLEMTKKLRGAISEKELTVATRATANFGNTPEANRMILLTQRGAAAKARAVENEAFRYIEENGNLGKGTIDGKTYNSFSQYKREFVNRDKEFVIKQVIPEINSLSEMKALVKISGGLNNLSDETVELMDQRLAELQ